ncbi:glycoside hydrolase family 16 protein [Dyadobacter luteus]|uniref:Glycoside hydrolase family 16 protein n=1 Tax=Dyadobacter luteus TaxID=2259619 RepID=A0A3D8Y3J1_9BACT|nr:glycoside hydrolase family 16 protein [Dyadobacter luteus]REA56706.1 glycoside hydrolase family 16 protein [Dyadobacter luteus]
MTPKILIKSLLFLTFSLPILKAHAQLVIPKNPVPKKYEFSKIPVWKDEFDYTGKPDTTKWGYDLGDHGWGNHELQNYTDRIENARVEDGRLIIEAKKESSGKLNYSSARLISKGKGDFLYGKFEIKAKLPAGTGTWPAIWMLPSDGTYGNNGWPDNGEIDIMEHVGFDPNRIHGNIHTKAFNHSIKTNKGGKIMTTNVSTGYHVYGCQWTPEEITISIDGVQYFKFRKNINYGWEEWPFDKPFHLLLNIAVGGDWGGQKGVDDSIFPQKLEIDYVRVYPLLEKK